VEQLTAEGITIRLVVKTRGAEQFGVTRELRRRLLMALTADDIDIGQTTVLVRDERDEDEDDEEVGAGAGSGGAGTVDTVPGPLTR
jgi:small-conductance mechanosensitive channel